MLEPRSDLLQDFLWSDAMEERGEVMVVGNKSSPGVSARGSAAKVHQRKPEEDAVVRLNKASEHGLDK